MPYVQSGTYAPGEVPEYAFCESVTAGPKAPWHIRKVATILKLTGGIDSSSLCGKVHPSGPEWGHLGGWDVNVKISEGHLTHTCPGCREAYRKIGELK